jgi:hypothetical protein
MAADLVVSGLPAFMALMMTCGQMPWHTYMKLSRQMKPGRIGVMVRLDRQK